MERCWVYLVQIGGVSKLVRVRTHLGRTGDGLPEEVGASLQCAFHSEWDHLCTMELSMPSMQVSIVVL